jgi:hypothetical protein
VNADAGVRPNRQHRKRLHDRMPRRRHPVRDQHGLVAADDAQRVVGDAGAHDVAHEQKRNGKAESRLRPLPRRKPQRLPHIDRPQRIAVVNKEGGQ